MNYTTNKTSYLIKNSIALLFFLGLLLQPTSTFVSMINTTDFADVSLDLDEETDEEEQENELEEEKLKLKLPKLTLPFFKTSKKKASRIPYEFITTVFMEINIPPPELLC